MSGDNFEAYLRDFKFVASPLGSSLTDSDKRITFINGLSNQVALEVLRAKPNSFEEAERAALEYYYCRSLTKNHVQSTSYTDAKVFTPLPDEVLFRIRAQGLNFQVPRGSHATASSVDVHLALAGKSIPSYLVVDRRVQGTI